MVIRSVIYYFVFILFSVAVQVRSEICWNMTQYDPCSMNSACGCFHMVNVDAVGICGFLSLPCSKLLPCDSLNNECNHQPESICVQHPRCNAHPVCYPASMMDKRICPKTASNIKWKYDENNGQVVAGGNEKGN